MYIDGFDFMRDLIVKNGKTEGLKIANNYLDMQGRKYGNSINFFKSNPEEYTFCVELYQATRQVNK